MKKYKISMFTKVEDKFPKLFNDRKEALIEREKMNILQPENIYTIDDVYIEDEQHNEE